MVHPTLDRVPNRAPNHGGALAPMPHARAPVCISQAR